MLVGFIGCPASGKTTLAALLFSYLKRNHYPSEIIMEMARQYILKKRSETKQQVFLTDEEQYLIWKEQYLKEKMYKEVVSRYTTVITDTCGLNTYLYLKTPDQCDRDKIAMGLRNPKDNKYNYDLLFYCDYVDVPTILFPQDNGRIHGLDEAKSINARIPEVLSEFGLRYFDEKKEDRATSTTVVKLSGPVEKRISVAIKHVMQYRFDYTMDYGPEQNVDAE